MENELLINFFIANCISADANVDNKDREKNITQLEDLLNLASILHMSGSQIKAAKKGIELLKKEIENDDIQQNSRRLEAN